jgi:hypothetical protein
MDVLGKGDRYVLPERPEGGFAQNVPVPFSEAEIKEHDPEMFKVLQKLWGK